jgi:micrococcal nuclease
VRMLTSLVLGRTIKLAYGQRRSDRYGRHLAQVFLGQGDSETWLQGELLSRGAARAYGLPGNFECVGAMLAHERVAREQRLALWSMDMYRPKPPRLAGSRRSRYKIVEGIVASVSPTKSATYLNFGDDWKTDFTARIGKDVLTAEPQFAARLANLKGRRVAVRGWIERRNGPMIEIRDPTQVDIIDEPGIGPALSQRGAPRATENASASEFGRESGSGDDAAVEPPGSDRDITKRPAEPDTVEPGAVDL